MFFIISKILSFLFLPLIWVFLLLIIAWLKKNNRWKQRLLATAIFILYFFSNEFIFNEMVRPWEVPAKSYEQLHTYDIGIVLGGGAFYDMELNRIIPYRAFDRYVQAMELYHRGKIKKIFISGGSGIMEFPEILEARYMREHLITLGIPEEDILHESKSKNTRENAQYTYEELKAQELEKAKLLLITSASHMPRATACFNKVGLATESFSTDRYAGPRRWMPSYLLLPNAETLFHWRVIIHEWVGMVSYKAAGYI